ncbi:MAG TPA: hypothetical protein DCX27_21160 [Balneola sp.]|nr:hypothetical protein [Balneola sp.]
MPKRDVSFALQKKPIQEAFEKIAELKVMIRTTNDINKKMLAIILEMKTKIDKLEKNQAEQIKDAKKSREGWIF